MFGSYTTANLVNLFYQMDKDNFGSQNNFLGSSSQVGNSDMMMPLFDQHRNQEDSQLDQMFHQGNDVHEYMVLQFL